METNYKEKIDMEYMWNIVWRYFWITKIIEMLYNEVKDEGIDNSSNFKLKEIKISWASWIDIYIWYSYILTVYLHKQFSCKWYIKFTEKTSIYPNTITAMEKLAEKIIWYNWNWNVYSNEIKKIK